MGQLAQDHRYMHFDIFPPKQGLYNPAFEKDSCGIGFVAHIKGQSSHQIMLDADQILRNLAHRGAVGCEPNTGDGAGVLTALPHEFMQKVAARDLKVDLPDPGLYSVGLVFLPTDTAQRETCKQEMGKIISEYGQQALGWRRVPTQANTANIGPSARATEPISEHLFVAAAEDLDQESFERKLYLIRKHISRKIRGSQLAQAKMFYVCSLSSKIIVYKGQLMSEQVMPYFPDLCDKDYRSHLAMVHARFSTNTFPSWDRAQPMRFMCHNGEINTVRGNMNWMRAREGVAKTDLFDGNLSRLFPILEPDCSDSGTFDNMLEFLLMTGRTLQDSLMMMIPEAWQNHKLMPENKRAFYEYHSCLMEPWDGPASIAFTDGHYIGAVLDRNGLRPSRYYVTHDDKVIMASEVGVLDVAPENVKTKGRLQPGKMFLVDFEQGKIIDDQELKEEFANRRPYANWLSKQRIELTDLAQQDKPSRKSPNGQNGDNNQPLISRLRAFGYTLETMRFFLLPLVDQEQDPISSMGNDAALACLSDHPRMLYDYFKQLFAQVTNPAIDSIREQIIMSLESYIGPEGNLLDTTENHCHRLRIKHPILRNSELEAIKTMDYRGWRTRTIDITYSRPTHREMPEDKVEDSEINDGYTPTSAILVDNLDRICAEAETAISDGYSLIILSDRNIGQNRVPVSALMACGAVHHHLVRQAKRTRIGIILETGEAREVHHHCLLIGYGADAINPYIAFEALWQARRDGLLADSYTDDTIVTAYRKGVAKGILKVIAKMGISTLQSYKGAQIFEALGLKDDVINRCFTGTPSRLQGVGFDVLATEAIRRHNIGYPSRVNGYTARTTNSSTSLPNHGMIHWQPHGEKHAWTPEAIANLQEAATTNSREAYQNYAQRLNEDSRMRCTLRSLLAFKNTTPISLDNVEPASEIVKRFNTGAMSFGSISSEAHETLAVAMNRIGGRSNTGEGGEDPERYKPLPNGDSKRSSIKQVASGRFGVTIWYLANADVLQIKISQGSKPGEGGELPGRKVDETIARTRNSTPGVGLISPPPHHDIYSIEDLKQLIHDLKNAHPDASISVKLVSEVGVGTIAAGVSKARADHILISGHDGGTGASPLTSIKHAGLPFELGIAETHQTLVLNDLRSRTMLQADGGIRTGRDVVIASLLGAEEFGFSTGPLITLGCIMMRKCHLNTCPVGIATQDPELRKKFSGHPEHTINYFFMVAEEVREIMATLGMRKVDEMIGRVDMLETDEAIKHWKSDGIDLTSLLTPAHKPHDKVEVRRTVEQDHQLDKALDHELIRLASPALEEGSKVIIKLPIKNINLAVGGMLSHKVVKRWGEHGLPHDTIHINLEGSAGQSFGAWMAKGVTMELEGDANDYVGKGLSGGRIVVYPPKRSSFAPEDNIIVGNVVLYGATSGQAFFRGHAAERFCVRNSGVHAVVEGIGDHGCEYMTGGRTVILGPTGRNFAAGMSGGIAYVWDMSGEFRNNARCNLAMVDLETIELDKEITELRRLIELHRQYTGSTVADQILNNWNSNIPRFVKVMPIDYKRVLTQNIYGKNRDSIVNPKGSAMEYPKDMKTNQRSSRS